jgi:hypothetical protein
MATRQPFLLWALLCLAPACANTDGSEENIQAVDTTTVRVARDANVARVNDQIRITIPGQDTVVFTDTPRGVEDGHHHVYRGVIKELDAYLVEIQLFEGRAFRLIDARSGLVSELDERPVVSPDAQRFITASWDTEAGYDPNRARIYRIDSTGLTIEWEISPERWGPDSARWDGNSRVIVRRAPGVAHPDSLSLRTPLIVTRVDGAWVVDSISATPPQKPTP